MNAQSAPSHNHDYEVQALKKEGTTSDGISPSSLLRFKLRMTSDLDTDLIDSLSSKSSFGIYPIRCTGASVPVPDSGRATGERRESDRND